MSVHRKETLGKADALECKVVIDCLIGSLVVELCEICLFLKINIFLGLINSD